MNFKHNKIKALLETQLKVLKSIDVFIRSYYVKWDVCIAFPF